MNLTSSDRGLSVYHAFNVAPRRGQFYLTGIFAQDSGAAAGNLEAMLGTVFLMFDVIDTGIAELNVQLAAIHL